MWERPSSFAPSSLVVAEVDRRMRAIAKRFVLRSPAAAQGHAISYFVRMPVRAPDRNAAAQPQRPRTVVGRILDEPDRGFEFRLDRLTGLVVPGHEAARGTIA